MKLFLLSDTHLRQNNPENRKDDFFETQKFKFEWCLKKYKEENCDLFLQAGDFFDSQNPSFLVLSTYLKLLSKYKIKINLVLGQHDYYYRSKKKIKKTGVGIFRSAGAVRILGKKPFKYFKEGDKKVVHLYGASFGEKIPIPKKEKGFKVLVVHKMISPEAIYPGQDFIHPRVFGQKYSDYDLILCGDYHRPFSDVYGKDKFIFNTGVMVRKKIDEADIKPFCIVFDTEEMDSELFWIPFKPSEEVFEEVIERIDTKDKEELEKFLKYLSQKETNKRKVSFQENLLKWYEKNNTNKKIINVIAEAQEEIK